MLRDLKQQSSGLGAKIVMGLIIISFMFWGVSGQMLSSSNDSAATVNGETITITKFNQANQAAKDRMKQQFGDNIGSEYFDTENFKRGVLSQLINSELLKQEAAKFDYDVSPEKIKSYIEASPGLQIDGKFSVEAYASYLAQVNKSAELLEREIRSDLQGSAIPMMVSDTSFALNSEVESQYKLSKQTRSFDYLELSSQDYTADIEVTEEEIKNHYNEFGSDYMTQEQVSVNYIELSTEDLLKDVEVSEEDLLEYYDTMKKSLMTAEKRLAQHILLPVSDNAEEVKVEIDKVAQRIADGEDFAIVAKEISQDPGSAKNGGDLGWVSAGDMVEAFDEKLFVMQVDDISEPILSKFGYHIIKLNEIKLPEISVLEEVKDQLTQELKSERAEEIFLTQADELDTIIIDSDNVLELAAETSGLELKTTELFTQSGGVGIAANPKFSGLAFTDAIKVENETSEMIALDDSHVAYIHIKEHKPPVVKPLEEVSEAIKTKLTAEKSLDLVDKRTKEYIEQIKAGKTTLADIATSLEKTVATAQDVPRAGSAHPYQLVQNVFKLKYEQDKQEVTAVASSANAFALVKLKSVAHVDTSNIAEADKASIASQIERIVANSDVQNLTTELNNSASITINDKIFVAQEQ